MQNRDVASVVVVPERILNKLESIHKKILFENGKKRKLDTVPLLQIIQTEVKKTLTYLPKLKLYNKYGYDVYSKKTFICGN